MHLHPVEVIGTEAILFGQVLQDPNQVCLVHGKVISGGVEVLARADTPQVAQAIVAGCATAAAAQ